MLNNITIMGRFVKDIELRQTQTGKSVCNATIACERDFSDGGNKQTDFIDIVAWGGTAEFLSRYFGKGKMAVINGRLQLRDWTDGEGKKHKAAEVIAQNVYFGESRNADGNSYSDTRSKTEFTEIGEDGELPF